MLVASSLWVSVTKCFRQSGSPDELFEVPEFYESERRIGCLLPFSLTIHTWGNSARILLMWSLLLCMESWRLISFGPYTTILDSFSCAAFCPDCSTNAYIFNQAQQFVVLPWFYYNMPYILVWKKHSFPGHLFLGKAESAAIALT